MAFHVPEHARLRLPDHPMSSDESYGNNGVFLLTGPIGRSLRMIASDGLGWEHVSVSLPKHIPNWTEMCFVKATFWDAEDTVMQLHPPKSTYVNNHPNCLHLWRPIGVNIPAPNDLLVGIPGLELKIHERLAE